MADYRRNPYNHPGLCPPMEQPRPAPKPVEPVCQVNEWDYERFPVAMTYVPWQKWCRTYDPEQGLKAGTIFPDLHKPFKGIRKGGCVR